MLKITTLNGLAYVGSLVSSSDSEIVLTKPNGAVITVVRNDIALVEHTIVVAGEDCFVVGE